MSTKNGSRGKEMVTQGNGWLGGQLDTCLLGLEDNLLSRQRLVGRWHAENVQLAVWLHLEAYILPSKLEVQVAFLARFCSKPCLVSSSFNREKKMESF